jgi:hypothetical protein
VSHQKSTLLSWIVAFKVLKSALLAALGVLIFRYSRRDPVSVLWQVAMAIHLPVTSRMFDRALRIATGLTVRRQIALGLTAFGYAALLGTEAVGLSLAHLRRQRRGRRVSLPAQGSLRAVAR